MTAIMWSLCLTSAAFAGFGVVCLMVARVSAKAGVMMERSLHEARRDARDKDMAAINVIDNAIAAGLVGGDDSKWLDFARRQGQSDGADTYAGAFWRVHDAARKKVKP